MRSMTGSAAAADPVPALQQAEAAGGFDTTYVAHADRRIEFSRPQQLPPGYDPTARPWYQQAAAAAGQPVLTHALPRRGGEQAGRHLRPGGGRRPGGRRRRRVHGRRREGRRLDPADAGHGGLSRLARRPGRRARGRGTPAQAGGRTLARAGAAARWRRWPAATGWPRLAIAGQRAPGARRTRGRHRLAAGAGAGPRRGAGRRQRGAVALGRRQPRR
ncbi:MAG: hypothetical protein MZW92_16150 [Comamonadaceae bacterium]|nr:hypothetical protein [Comamonadaceae bacterium]